VSAGPRRPLVAGNWKLYKTLTEAIELAAHIAPQAGSVRCELAVAPVFTALTVVREQLGDAPVALAAQDCYWEREGAFTGEVSAALLADAGCRYVIVGHSERRQHFGELDEHVRRKARAVLDAGMAPIVCCGESLAQREAGQTEAHVLGQVRAALDGLDAEVARRVVIAYEPIWAIGTGRNASPADAQAVHVAIRAAVAERLGRPLAEGMRILYGGSVKPDNARSLLSQPDVDGALVGGASLDAASFMAIGVAADSAAESATQS
jgi:triosephosphate isomerase